MTKNLLALSEEAKALHERLSVEDLDEELFLTALYHRSYLAEHAAPVSNERLEFLGDSVLGLVVTEELYKALPSRPEGDLARIRAAIVSKDALAPVAAALGLGRALLIGHGEERTGGREKPSLLADGLEALFGAVYLSCGLEAARGLVLGLLEEVIGAAASAEVFGDPKNQLQELASMRALPAPRYEVEGRGPDHDRRFVARVALGPVTGTGEGRTKRAAERAAALEAIGALEKGTAR